MTTRQTDLAGAGHASISGPLNVPISPDPGPAVASEVPTDSDAAYSAYFPFVWRCLRGLGVPPTALRDAAQDVFLVVHRRMQDFRGSSSFRTWLYGIVRKVASNHRRSVRRRDQRTASLDESLPSDAAGPNEQAQEAEAARFVQDFVRGLDDKKRDVFVLVMLEELAVPEVAEVLGIPLNTAYTRLRSVRLEFRAALAKHEATP